MSQQWNNLSPNQLNMSEADIEKLLSANAKSGLLFMTGRKNVEKRSPVTCIPEPSTYNAFDRLIKFSIRYYSLDDDDLYIAGWARQVHLCRAKIYSTGGRYDAAFGSFF